MVLRDTVEVHASALLEIGELGDLQTVEHHLPADTPRAKSRRFPVIFFELDIVLAQIDADGFEARQILVDDVVGRRLEDDL